MTFSRPLRKIFRTLGYILYLLIFTIIALEVILHIYNPFPVRVKGDRIMMPANQTHHFRNDLVPGLDKEISIEYNSLGLRGPERPPNYDSCLSIITVGGSTTFGWYISTEKTWPYLLSGELSKSFKNVWLNNAGMAGQTTYGHIVLMKDHLVPLKPKVMIFMMGINDVGIRNIGPYDSVTVRSFKKFILTYSETANLVLAFLRYQRAIERKLTEVNVDFNNYDTLNIPENKMQEVLIQLNPLVSKYEQRVRMMMEMCKANNIFPIIMTQPLIFGNVTDSVTGADLGKIKIKDGLNGELWARKLELYNDVLKRIAAEYNIPCIDLAAMLPKSTRYFCDYMHHTNEGASKITELITPHITKYLAEQFPGYLKGE